jgi:hypothetical protein
MFDSDRTPLIDCYYQHTFVKTTERDVQCAEQIAFGLMLLSQYAA